MKAHTRIGLALLLAVGFGTSAGAAVVPFTGSISVAIAGLPGVPVPGAGLATVNNSAGVTTPFTHLALPGGAFATTLSVPLPNLFPIVGIVVSAANGAAVFSSAQTACGTLHSQVTCSGGGLLHGRAGLAGAAFVGLFGTATAPFANLTVPLGAVGAGSTINVASPLGVTVMGQAAGWTTGTVAVSTLGTGVSTAMGGQTPSQIVLVTPLSLYTGAAGGYLPSFATWTVNLQVPEPGLTLLLGTAAVALAVAGLRRRR